MSRRPVLNEPDNPYLEHLEARFFENLSLRESLLTRGPDPLYSIYNFKKFVEIPNIGSYYAYIFTAFVKEKIFYFSKLIESAQRYTENRKNSSEKVKKVLEVIVCMINDLIIMKEQEFIVGYFYSERENQEISKIKIEIIFCFYPIFRNFFEVCFSKKIFEVFNWAVYEHSEMMVDIIIKNHLELLKASIFGKSPLSKTFSKKLFSNFNIVNKISTYIPTYFSCFEDYSCEIRNSEIANLLIFTGYEKIVNIRTIEDSNKIKFFMLNFPLHDYLNKKFRFDAKYLKIYSLYCEQSFLIDYKRLNIAFKDVAPIYLASNSGKIIDLIRGDIRNYEETAEILATLKSVGLTF